MELQKYNLSIDDLFKWFYESYLVEEFGIKDFHYQSVSNGIPDIDKCILISCGIENILKQFKVYCEKGTVDREYFEMNSTPISCEQIGSLIKNKYAYVSNSENGNLLKREMNFLFGNNYTLSHCEKLKDSKKLYKNIIQLLSKERINVDDFYKHQRENVSFLIQRGALSESPEGLKVNVHRAAILKLLYENDCLALAYLKSFSSIIDDLIESGCLVLESELFSRPEQDYLSYLLNNRKYDNGLSLRNKYVHGTYSLDKDVNNYNHYLLMSVACLIMIKINEEFCLLDENNKR